jgi:hypothetical protein
VSLKMWHIANEDSFPGGEKERGRRSALVSPEHGMLQTRAHLLEGRKREKREVG